MANTDFVCYEDAGVNLYQVDTTPGFPLGHRVQGKSATLGAAEFVYLKGVSSCVEGSWVIYRPKAFTPTLLTANDIGAVAVALAAVNAGTSYGWFQVRGKAVGKALASYADDAWVYATSTAGSIDDAVVAGDRVKCARSCSALDTPVTGQAYFDITFPFMDDGQAA